MTLLNSIYSQFANPHGILGELAGFIMSKRPSNIKRNKWTVMNLALKPDDTVLEIGYGPGIALEACGKQVTNGFIVGLDHSIKMYKLAKKRNIKLVESNILDLRLGDIESYPIREELFSKIFCTNVAQFWKHQSETLEYLHELLMNEGLLAITFQPRHPGAKDSDSEKASSKLAKQMEDVGFRNIRIKTLNLSPKVSCVMGEK